MKVSQWLISGHDTATGSAEIGALGLRVFAGLAMALAHGLGKVPPSEGFVGAVAELGFPVPGLFAWAAGLSECLGGLLLAVGLATRPSALVLCFTMAVAAFGTHGGDAFSAQEKALLYLVVFGYFLLAGAGRFSIDGVLRKRRY
jgi:putative oxidoreductase